MKKTFLLFTPFLITFFAVTAFADKDVDVTKIQVSNLYATSGASVGSSLSASSDQTLVYYPFSSDLNYTTLASSISSSTIDFSNINNLYIENDGFGSVLEAYPANGATDYATAVSNNSYFTITLNVASLVNMDSLIFEVGKGGGTDPRGYFIRSSVNGFTTDLISETLPSGNSAAPVRKSIALGTVYDGVSNVTFRLCFYSLSPSSNSVDWSDLYVKGGGSSAVPVSKWNIVAAMLLIALFALYRMQKKRKIELKA